MKNSWVGSLCMKKQSSSNSSQAESFAVRQILMCMTQETLRLSILT